MNDTSLIGKAKELAVASQLVRVGIHVFFPLVDNGIDLIAASRNGSVLVPVQVKFKASRTGFALDAKKAEGYTEETVLAFGSGWPSARATPACTSRSPRSSRLTAAAERAARVHVARAASAGWWGRS